MTLFAGLVPVPAAAGGGCVSRPEHRRVEIGMRKARVHCIFDTQGDLVNEGPNYEERAYDTCPRYKGVDVFAEYENSQVLRKSWMPGE